MRWLWTGLLFLLSFPALAQVVPVTGFCVNGANPAVTSGLPSSNFNQSLIKKCTVQVFQHGTTTPVTIYADGNQTALTNPFTANVDASWTFYAAPGVIYDVTLSGGIPPNTYATPRTLVINVASGTGGGTTPPVPSGCGSLPNDVTSTDCGTGNRVGGAAPIPANISTYGYYVARGSSGNQVVAIGYDDATVSPVNLNDGAFDVVAVGDKNFTSTYGSDTVAVGSFNIQGPSDPVLSCQAIDVVSVGDGNLYTCPAGANFQGVVMVGDNNMPTTSSTVTNGQIFDVVAIGNSNAGNAYGPLHAGNNIVAIGAGADSTDWGNHDVIAIGDEALCCYRTATTPLSTFTDVIMIGDAPGSIIGGQSANIIGIGDCVLCSGYSGADQDVIAIGDSAVQTIDGAHNIVAIGDGPLEGFGNNGHVTGHDVIAFGYNAGSITTSAIENIYIGDMAGCPGCSISTPGNGTTAGSEQIDIGDSAGQCNTNTLNDIIAIGDNGSASAHDACAANSNTAVIGGPSTIHDILLSGTVHIRGNGSTPTSSAGILTGTNNGGKITGVSGVTSVTITFAGGTGFTSWNSCVANASVINSTPALTTLDLLHAVFTFPAAYTGVLYYHCDGN